MKASDATTTGPLDGPAVLATAPGTRRLAAGYVEEEWFLSGHAASFTRDSSRRDADDWAVLAGPVEAYRTRLIVRRPADPHRFNGTVIVEWLNVSGGTDADPVWGYGHRHLARAGYAWIGVSAQRAGIEGGGLAPGPFLKQLDPGRYEALSHPGDAFSFDIFTQAARAARRPDSLLGSLVPSRVLAVGESQSALFLATYVNAIAPLAQAFDGYLIVSRPAGAAPLGGLPPGDLAEALPLMLAESVVMRDDIGAPVLAVQTETDVVLLRSASSRQSDSNSFRLWEVAGAAHADTYLLVASASHDDRTTIAELAALCAATATPIGPELAATTPINAGPHLHYVLQAAIEHLDRWSGGGLPPASAPLLELCGDETAFESDELGIATGGVRTGWVDVPTCVLSGVGQGGSEWAFLFGSTLPFPASTLQAIYPGGRDDYVEQFAAATANAVAGGFLLEEDVPEIVALATAMYPAAGN